MAWHFRAVPQSGTETALDVSDYFVDEVRIVPTAATIAAAMDEPEKDVNKINKHNKLRKLVSANDVVAVKTVLSSIVDDEERTEIVNMIPSGDNSLVYIASQGGKRDLVEMLFDAGANGIGQNARRNSALLAAVHNSHINVVKCILEKCPITVQQTTIEQWSPLHAACINGHVEIVQILINHSYPEFVLKTFGFGADGSWECRLPFDPNMQDVTGQTPLYVACLLGNTLLVQMLLDWKVKFTKNERSFSAQTSETSAQSTTTTPSKRRVSLGIQSIMDRLYLVRDGSLDENNLSDEYKCPIELNMLCGAPRETALLAAVRGGYTDVVAILLERGADPNVIACPMNENSLNEEMYGFSNSPLAEATRQKSTEIIELLLKHGANDDQSTALAVACAQNDDQIIGRLLSHKAHTDPEYKINKQKLDNTLNSQHGNSMVPPPSTNSITYSNIFPTNSVMINWHFSNCQLAYIKVAWLFAAVQQCNPKLRVSRPTMKAFVLGAITRIDLSHNCLSHLPVEIFYLCSLRYLNVAQNKLEKIPLPNAAVAAAAAAAPAQSTSLTAPRYDCPLLEELYLQDNRLEEVPAAIFDMDALITLDVSNNKLQKLPYGMWNAPKLRDLNVAFNLLKDLPYFSSKQQLASLSDDVTYSPDQGLFHEHATSGSHHHRRNRLTKIDLIHHSVWFKSLEISEQDVPMCGSRHVDATQLTNLNLANNLFTHIPLALPCLAMNLTRLNMSYNSLRSMGHVTSYPASLRQLDLSHNEITCWPSLPSRLTTQDPHLVCYNIATSSSSNSPSEDIDDGIAAAASVHHENRSNSLRNAVLKSVCIHRKHLRLESLRTLILADNLLTRIQLTTDDVTFTDDEEHDWSVVGVTKLRLMFPNLSMLDISNNCLKEIPQSLYELSNLSVLNISGNIDITDLPPNMGLLSRLWNLNTRGCSLQGPLRSMIENGKYKTMDIIGYLKSVYEDARPYARMKLMVVGAQGIGKTSLLELLRQESTVRSKRSSADHWTKRIGGGGGASPVGSLTSSGGTGKEANISTVGVDIGDWICEKRIRGQSQHGPVVFRTWDFGGQKEYYTTHQYFLSKRSLYIVVWRIVDGKNGLAEVLQWLANIQARAPNSPVIIVGTHQDKIGSTVSAAAAAKMQQIIRDRFIAVTDAEKMGLPRVLDSIEVSCRTNSNITLLANVIYDMAFSLRSAGSKELLLHQKVPSTYLALEDVIASISTQMRASGIDPVLNFDRYKEMVNQEMAIQNHKGFRDSSELNQATMFLHDNGVILHYDDATLRDLYFVDPQWLCDMLAHVVTIREINPFARNGIMKLDDLQHVFKGTHTISSKKNGYIVNLLNKFEVALTWDSRTLLIPSLLPADETECSTVKIANKTTSWSVPEKIGSSSLVSPSSSSSIYHVHSIPQPDKSISRLLLMSYFPSGFWSRLLTRILADIQIVNALKDIYPNQRSYANGDIPSKWELWQTGIALYNGDELIFKMKEIPHGAAPDAFAGSSSPYRNAQNQFQLMQEGTWCNIDIATSSILEMFFPASTLSIQKSNDSCTEVECAEIDINKQCLTQILALCVDHIDILLEDWYPTLGTRFVHTSEGRFLVTRLIPCPKCFQQIAGTAVVVPSLKKTNNEKRPLLGGRSKSSSLNDDNMNYAWMMEECILAAYEKKLVTCPVHGDFPVCLIAPDIMFIDLKESYLIDYKNITKGPLLGRGAFGFVFKATCKLHKSIDGVPVAMKMLQPVQPGPRAKETAILAYKAILGKWKRDPLQHACKAYCMARQELSVILILKHPNIVSLVGVCVQPLAIVLEWAPKGALDEVIREFRRSGSRIGPYCFQMLVLQASRAIEYLHRKHIIYRDLKAENVLVWEFPHPHSVDTPANKVYIKIADYGISRVTLPSGTKGFGGTEGFMAPEIMKYNGEEEYTEKVDCFSFGMFLYELIALRQPFEGHEAVKECILEGGRPVLTRRETQFPSYCLDLMVLCWDQQPKIRPSASQIVSIASAPEFTHLIDVVSMSHNGDVQAAVAQKSSTEADDGLYEIWLASTNFRLELLTGSKDKWMLYQRIGCPPALLLAQQPAPDHCSATTTNNNVHMTTICSVGEYIWIGDSESKITAFHISDCSHAFSYVLEPNSNSPVTLMVNLHRINRVAVGLRNGRLFLLDPKQIPASSILGEGSFVLTELGTGDQLYSACVVWTNDEECELWCGVAGAQINIFSLRDSVVSERKTLVHQKPSDLMTDFTVSFLYPTENGFVYSNVSPGCVLYQWNAHTKTIDNRLDCSKLVPCSESLNSISIDEHLSPGKCQITAICKLNETLYVGTSWGCIVVIEHDTLRPITIFRPFQDEVQCILPISTVNASMIATIGRGYRSLIRRYTDPIVSVAGDDVTAATSQMDRSSNIHALFWKAEHWIPI